MTNPFSKNTIAFTDFETMSDLKWHCVKCELKSTQAKTWQVWRQEKGIQLDQDEKGNFYKKMFCPNCNINTIHRKLKSTKLLEINKARSGISSQVAKKVKNLYNFEEAVLLRKLSEKELEVDHKFPQIRWENNETNNNNLSDNELKEKFMLLNRSNNLLKSRQCEQCVKTGIRGCFPGIKFWYKGTEKWEGKTKCDPNGCIGCFWNNPYKWRDELNKILKKKQ